MTQIDEPQTRAFVGPRSEDGAQPGPPQRQDGQQAPQTPQINVGEASGPFRLPPAPSWPCSAFAAAACPACSSPASAGHWPTAASPATAPPTSPVRPRHRPRARPRQRQRPARGTTRSASTASTSSRRSSSTARPSNSTATGGTSSNLPRIMSHLESVEVRDDRHSHWVAKAQVAGGKQFEWDAEITHDEPNTLIGWRSLPGADIDNAGQIRFAPAIGDRGTEVHVFIDYVPPAGPAGPLGRLHARPEPPPRGPRGPAELQADHGDRRDPRPSSASRTAPAAGRGERHTESEWKPLFT